VGSGRYNNAYILQWEDQAIQIQNQSHNTFSGVCALVLGDHSALDYPRCWGTNKLHAQCSL